MVEEGNQRRFIGKSVFQLGFKDEGELPIQKVGWSGRKSISSRGSIINKDMGSGNRMGEGRASQEEEPGQTRGVY